jgi:hypothetical protein
MGRDGPQTPYAPPSNPPSDLGSEVGARMQEQLQLEEEYMGRAAPMPVLHVSFGRIHTRPCVQPAFVG